MTKYKVNHFVDLFDKVIPMAGTACHNFALTDPSKIRQNCLELAISFGFKPPEKGSFNMIKNKNNALHFSPEERY